MGHAKTPALTLSRRRLPFAGLLALLAVGLEGTTAPWVENLHLTATGTAAWVNNQSRTSTVSTRKDSATYEFILGGSQPRQLAPSLLWVASGEISALHVQEYDLANQVRAGGRVSLQRKFGLGPLAPVLQVSGGVAYKSARFAGDRGWTTEAGIQLAKRVRPDLRLAAGAQWLEHGARSNVFDLVQYNFFFDATWDLNDRWSLSGSVSRRDGDIVANAAWPVWAQVLRGSLGSAVQNYYNSRPWAETEIYGPRWVSYNVEAKVDLWSVAVSYRLSDHTAVELRQSAAYVVNRIDIRYPTDSVGLSLNHRF